MILWLGLSMNVKDFAKFLLQNLDLIKGQLVDETRGQIHLQ